MNRIKIFGDSTLDLSEELCEKYGVTLIPLTVLIGGTSYKDGVEIQPQQIFEYVDKTGELPKTAAVNSEIYKETWGQYLNEGYDIIHFNISSDMSNCYQSACIAAKEIAPDHVFVIDTANLSTGSALLALYASDLIQQGLPAKEIAEKCQKRVPSVQASFILDRLNYLHKGGRCSSIALLAASALSIKPSIRVKGGKMGASKKYIGKFLSCTEKYVKDLLVDFSTPDYTRVFITHTSVPAEVVARIKEILSAYPFKEILDTNAGCTISSHCGPCCIGVLFINDGDQK